MCNELLQVYDMFDRDDRVKCIVLTGHGKMFCAGADLNLGFSREIEGTRAKDHRDG
jgi:enoyl-CoA hydratase/carnithine racemase